MREISWNRAFIYAFKYLAFTILWTIVGLVLIWLGVSLIILSLWAGYGAIPGLTSSVVEAPGIVPRIGIILGIILVILGYIVIFVGYSATFFKLLSKLIVESMAS